MMAPKYFLYIVFIDFSKKFFALKEWKNSKNNLNNTRLLKITSTREYLKSINWNSLIKNIFNIPVKAIEGHNQDSL